MKHIFIFIILCVSIRCFGEVANENPFEVSATISSNNLSIDQETVLQLNLKYPSEYHPDINLAKRQLLTYAGLNEPPFILVKEDLHPPQESEGIVTQQIDFTIAPQRTGTHFLSARLIAFTSNSTENKQIEVPSDMFAIKVYNEKKDVNLPSLIQPPMNLSKELPINLSQENRKTFLRNPQVLNIEAERNVEFMKNKEIPWITILSTLAVMVTILCIRLLPATKHEETIDPLTKEKNEAEIRNELEKLSKLAIRNEADVKDVVLQQDLLLRRYLQNQYAFPAFAFTSQELMEEMDKIPDLSVSSKEQMSKVFSMADKIKFAQYEPNLGDAQFLKFPH
jgi:hypothetical protein